MNASRRAILGTAAGVATSLAGCTGIIGGGGDARKSPSGDPLDSPAANAPLPDDAGDRTYAAMGTGGSEVVYFGSWKCPFCAEFAVGSDRVLSLSTIVTDYVESEDAQLTYRCLAYTSNGPFLGPDAPRAARAGLSVWNRDPEAYWGYHEYVMANQPPESETWATTDRLVEFAQDAGVENTEGLRVDLQNGKYEEAVRATTKEFNQAGASGTPTLVVDGQTYSPFEPEKTRQALDALAE